MNNKNILLLLLLAYGGWALSKSSLTPWAPKATGMMRMTMPVRRIPIRQYVPQSNMLVPLSPGQDALYQDYNQKWDTYYRTGIWQNTGRGAVSARPPMHRRIEPVSDIDQFNSGSYHSEGGQHRSDEETAGIINPH